MLSLRTAHPTDLGRLTEIAHAAKRHWGYPEEWIAAWKDDLTITAETLESYELTVASRGDEICGFSALAVTPPDLELEHMWVHPEAMGRGVGRLLFEHLRQRAREAGGERLVILSDPNAVGFYELVGARKTGEHHGTLLGEPRILPIYTLDLG